MKSVDANILVYIGIFIAQLYIFYSVESWEIRAALALFMIFKFWQGSKNRGNIAIVNVEEEKNQWKFKSKLK